MGTVHQYRIAENVSNLAIWRSGEKFPNEIPQISTPRDSGRKAHHSSTYDYVLHHYFKIAVYSPENAMSGYALGLEAHREQEALQAQSHLQVQQVHSREGKSGTYPNDNGPAKQGLLSA